MSDKLTSLSSNVRSIAFDVTASSSFLSSLLGFYDSIVDVNVNSNLVLVVFIFDKCLKRMITSIQRRRTLQKPLLIYLVDDDVILEFSFLVSSSNNS